MEQETNIEFKAEKQQQQLIECTKSMKTQFKAHTYASSHTNHR